MFSSDNIYILSVGACKLVLAEFTAKPGETPVLQNYVLGEVGLTPDSDSDPAAYISAEFVRMSAALGMHGGASVWIALSGQVVFPRFVKLPPVAKEKLQTMIQYEAEQNVPFPISELVWDYSLIGAAESGEQYAMIVAAKNENVSVITDLVSQAGFEPRVVDVVPMALYNCTRWNYPGDEGCTLVVDIGARSTNFVYVEDGHFFSRTVPIAGNTITQEIAKTFQIGFKEAEAMKREVAFVALGGNYAPADTEEADRTSKIIRNVVTRLHAEINRSTNFYRSQQGGSAPARVLLTGGSSVIPYMDTFFREKLQVEVDYFNPFLRVTPGSRVDTQKLGTDAFVLADVTGLAVRQTRECDILINLIPQAILRRQTFRKRLPALGAAAVVLAAVLAVWGFYAKSNATLYTRQSESVKSRLASLKTAQQELNREINERQKAGETAELYRAAVAQRSHWVLLLANLQDVLKPANKILAPKTRHSIENSLWLTAVEPVIKEGRLTHLRLIGRAWNDDMKVLEDTIQKERGVDRVTAIEILRERIQAKSVFGEVAIDYERYSGDETLRLFQLTVALNP